MSEIKLSHTSEQWELVFEPAWKWCVKLGERYLAFRIKKEADARLMAAAPELLAALKACHLQLLQSNNNSEYAEQANQMAIAAVAKAEFKRGER